MLSVIDKSGKFYQLDTVPHFSNFRKHLRLFSKEVLVEIYQFIDRKLADTYRFSVATLFGGEWDYPIKHIYDVLSEDEREAGFLLGKMVMHRVIHHPAEWVCTKANMQGRDFDVSFYWRPD